MLRVLDETELAGHEAQLARDGFTIVPRLLDEIGVSAVRAAMDKLHAAQDFGENDFTGFRTKRVFNLFAKTRVLDPLLCSADVLRLVRSMLGPEAQLSIASTMELYSGETPQPLHQDDAYFPGSPHPALVINTMWALTEFTEANGATRVVPGSHLSAGPVDQTALSVAAEMPAGSVLLWERQLWHGGGANHTNSERFGVSLNYCRGWIRQQENQYLSLDPYMVTELPDELQQLLGFNICQFVGWVDGRHPARAIIPEVAHRIHAGQSPRRKA
jgi:ectoine hydroxylase-related dioxygenase (phytanoyl-CoA dioxygenase family)